MKMNTRILHEMGLKRCVHGPEEWNNGEVLLAIFDIFFFARCQDLGSIGAFCVCLLLVNSSLLTIASFFCCVILQYCK